MRSEGSSPTVKPTAAASSAPGTPERAECALESSQQSAAQGASTIAGILALPDHLITQCLRHLKQEERLTSVALVCKRFAELSLCPEERGLHIKLTGAQAVERGLQLLLWLPGHAQRIKCLKLKATSNSAAAAAELEDITAHFLAQLSSSSSGSISNISGNTSGSNSGSSSTISGSNSCSLLRSLRLQPAAALSTAAWLPALGSLRFLELGSLEHPLLLTGPLHLLTSAQRFVLSGCPIQFDGDMRLPPSLTQLQLHEEPPMEDGMLAMPPQVTTLSRLQVLVLDGVRYSADSMADLARLRRLEYLDLNSAAAVPATLSAMTGLSALSISSDDESARVPGLDAHLLRTSQLTWLWLGRGCAYALPALACLQRLEYFCMWTHEDVPMRSEDGRPLPRLPDGPPLSALRELDLTWPLLVNSLPALQHAAGLTQLVISSMPCPAATPAAGWSAFWEWAASHPPLKELRFCLSEEWDGKFSCKTVAAVMQLRERRPSLRVSREDMAFD